jgi:leader peptidase (prepilin peptidase)/N-methyltransferase
MENAYGDDITKFVIMFVLAFIAGASAGSFINAAAMRTVADKKWWGNERSACDSCGHVLGTLDLVPVISFLALMGKCRYCKAPIKPRHFVAELISGSFTAILFWRWGFSPALLMAVIVLWFSLFNSLTDFDNGYIYDVWALSLGVIGLLIRIAGGWHTVLDGVFGAALGFGFIAIIILVSRGGMGWGDALLMAGIGGAIGWKYCVFGMYMGFLAGGVVVLPLLLTKKLKRKDAIPLGPFLAIGCVLVLFTGTALVAHFGEYIGYNPGWPW